MDAIARYREALLDVTINVIVLGMLAFFLVLIVSSGPWGPMPPLLEATVVGLHVVPIVGLGAVTALAAVRLHDGH